MTGTEITVNGEKARPGIVQFGGENLGLEQLMELSKVLAQSTLLPESLRGKAANVMITVMYGQELGLTPVQALQGIYVVNGRPSLAGQTWLSLVRRAGHRQWVTCAKCSEPPENHNGNQLGHAYEKDHNDDRCSVTISRGDTKEQHTETFTYAEAERARLTNKDVWKAWRRRMLLWRATSNCATVICPEVALGFEMQGAEPAEQTDTARLGAVAAQRTDRRMDGVPPTQASAEYTCPNCGTKSDHYEDECPNVEPVAPPVGGAFDADALAADLAEIEREHAPDTDGGLFGDGTENGPR